MTVLETERLLLRPLHAGDLDALAELNADPRVMQFFPALYSRAESLETIQRSEASFQKHGFGRCGAELKGTSKLIGSIGLAMLEEGTAFAPCAELGWRLLPEYWNRGLATEGAKQVLEHAFTLLGLPEVVAFCAAENAASRRVMEKLGMARNPDEDFDFARMPAGHRYRRHVLYRLSHEDWARFNILPRAV